MLPSVALVVAVQPAKQRRRPAQSYRKSCHRARQESEKMATWAEVKMELVGTISPQVPGLPPPPPLSPGTTPKRALSLTSARHSCLTIHYSLAVIVTETRHSRVL